MATERNGICRCVFCGRDENEADVLIHGPIDSTLICGECVAICHQLLENSGKSVGNSENSDGLNKWEVRKIKSIFSDMVDCATSLKTLLNQAITHFIEKAQSCESELIKIQSK